MMISTKIMIENDLNHLSNKYGFYASLIDMQEMSHRFEKYEEGLTAVLSERELDHLSSLKLNKNKMQWISGRYAVKLALFKYKARHKSLLDLSCIDILKAQDLGPYIEQYPAIYSSISHSFPYCIGVISEHKIGVDIEKVFNPSESLIKCYFNKNEKEALADCENAKLYAIKSTAFWTRKEAVSKYLRLGMKMNFREVDTTKDIIIYGSDSDQINLNSFTCNDFCVSLALSQQAIY